MGHGTHWEAVLNNLHDDFPRVLDSGITSGHVIGRRRKPAWHGPVGIEEAEITLIQAAESGFGTLGAVVKDSSRNYLHTAFPIATRGETHRIRVADVHESSFGLEARITAEIGEAKITFFEPYYVLNSGQYRPEVELDVILVGIVYRLQVADRNETVIHPQIGETHLGGAAVLLSMRDADSGNLPANGFGLAYILEPSDRPGPDDYSFRGPLKNVQPLDFLTSPASRMTATLLRINDGDIDIDIDLYVMDRKIHAGQMPAVGDDVAGVLWLQGFAAER